MNRLAKALRSRREHARNRRTLVDAIEAAPTRSARDELIELAWMQEMGRHIR